MNVFINKNFQLKLVRIISFTVLLLSAILILWKVNLSFSSYSEIQASRYSDLILIIALLYLLFGLSLLIFSKHAVKKLNLLLLLGAINLTYLITEFLLLFTSVNPNPYEDKRHFYFNKVCFEYHQTRGYKWKDCNCREVLVSAENKLVWDKTIRVNNVGYNSFQDYHKKKQLGIKRYMVLGDSFTAAEFNDSSWVDYANSLFKKDSIELYSFALSGIGLQNWHTIYFNEILPNYEFDGVIIGFLSDDWLRKFTIFHTDSLNNIYIGGFDNPPTNFTDFEENYISKMVTPKNWSITSDHEMNENMNTSNPVNRTITLKLLELIYYKLINPPTINSKNEKCNIEINSIKDIQAIYGEQKLNLLTNIIEDCKTRNKEVILCNIPLKHDVVAIQREEPLLHQASLQYLSKHFKINYFNGAYVFKAFKPKQLDNCYHQYDNHWNDYGSKQFAIQFSKSLTIK